jgi:SAM-dependent methyltransferase
MEEQIAKIYADHRPYFHAIITDKIRARIDVPVGSALDVACGTGQSTEALRGLAHHIVGIDISPAMLVHAPRTVSYNWAVANAERLPFAMDCFDLVTVGLAYHWFDHVRFLLEVHRVLRPGGHLVIYNNGFRGRMLGDDTFEAWFTSTYLARFPSPPRASAALTEIEAAQHGLCLEQQEQFSNVVDFSLDELVGYLTSQSNVIAQIESGHETLDEIQQWLSNTLLPWLRTGRRSFFFGGWIWYLSKPAPV